MSPCSLQTVETVRQGRTEIVKAFKEQLFTGFDICEFEDLFREKPVQHLTTVAVDSVLEMAERRSDFRMSDDDFEAFVRYQMHMCQKRELLGYSNHLLYICRKQEASWRALADQALPALTCPAGGLSVDKASNMEPIDKALIFVKFNKLIILA